MNPLNKTLGLSPVIWDGGQGTTLADFYGASTDSPVWSSSVVETHPETLVDMHLRFMRSGAQVIESATYQAAYSTYALAGHPDRAEAERLMRAAVHIAADARKQFASESQPPSNVKIALSLGAFGATLVPTAHEFDGVYPAPFGPDTPSARFADEQDNTAREAEDALTAFHLERLRVFAADAETWAQVDMLVFETIPLLREVRAVRRAVTALYAEGGVEVKPWGVSTVWEGGMFPEASSPHVEVAVSEVLEAALGAHDGARRPDAFGVNCTLLADVAQIARAVSAALPSVLGEQAGERPWLTLKPNGGKVYDPTAKTWADDPRDAKEGGWTKGLARVVREADSAGVWGGVLVGGCCKTGFGEVERLREALHCTDNK